MWLIALKFLKGVPWKKVMPIVFVCGILAANFFYIFKLTAERDIARAKRDKAVAELVVAEGNYAQCKLNRVEQDKILELFSAQALLASAAKEKLDLALEDALAIANTAAEAREELAEVSARYDAIRERSQDVNLCVTYEMVLRALAGEE